MSPSNTASKKSFINPFFVVVYARYIRVYELTEDSQSIGSSSFGQVSLLLVSICLHPSPSHEVTVPTMEARFRRISR